MICPVCERALSNKATACLCGWQKPDHSAAKLVDCGFEGCRRPAIIRRRVAEGSRRWINVCEFHDVEMETRIAKEWEKTVGLDKQPSESSREWRVRVLAWHKQNAKGKYPTSAATRVGEILARQREPGDDDEELPA